MQVQPGLQIDGSTDTDSMKQGNDCEQESDAQGLAKYLKTVPSKDIIKASVKGSVYKLTNLVEECDDKEILQTVQAHMLSAISLMEATASRQPLPFSPTINVAPNTNNIKQDLFSTKKTPVKRKRIAKPS